MAKGNVNKSQAEMAYEDAARQAVDRSMSTWLPVQQYYAGQVQQQRPAQAQMGRDQAAAGARAQGAALATQALRQDAAMGAGAGSGRFLMGLQGAGAAGAQASALGQAGASANAEHNWVRGLQDVIGMGHADQAAALGGMQAAAKQEQAYEQERASYKNAAMQGIGNFIGNQLLGGSADFGAGQQGGGGGSSGGSGGSGMFSSFMNMMGSGGGSDGSAGMGAAAAGAGAT